MDKLNNFKKLPKDIKTALLENGEDMRRFYTFPTAERQRILDNIMNLKSKEEWKTAVQNQNNFES